MDLKEVECGGMDWIDQLALRLWRPRQTTGADQPGAPAYRYKGR